MKRSNIKYGVRLLANHVLGLVLLLGLGGAAVPRPAAAAPAKRYAVQARGDFVIFGNTLAQDCGAGVVAPTTGTIGACGLSTADTAPDIFWQSDAPADGQADASLTITPATARTTAMLVLPQGASVLYARLYWAARQSAAATPVTATFERPGTFSMSLTPDATATVALSGTFYQRSVDVTALVKQHGAGAYRLGNIDSAPLANLNDSTIAAGWYVVVFYRLDSQPTRSLSLYDGLDLVIDGAPASFTLSGFRVPAGAVSGKLGVVAFEGDDGSLGDGLTVNGTAVFDAINPVDNFFNSSRSVLGAVESQQGDLPRLTGGPRSMSGIDIDVVDISARLRANDTSMTVDAFSTGDAYVTGAFVTSIASVRPEFSGLKKTVRNLSRSDGSYQTGDEVEYSISISNGGTDAATDVVVTDPLPTGITYSADSLEIVSGDNPGRKSDMSGDDQAEYDANSRTIKFRLGQMASNTQGGTIPAADPATLLRFRARLDQGTIGLVKNQATLENKGAYAVSVSSLEVDTWLSGDGTTPREPTAITVTPGQGTVSPDVAIAVQAELINQSSAVRYTAVVSNAGSVSAPRLVLTYRLVAQTQLTDLEAGEGWSCVTGAEQLTCSYTMALASGSAPPVRFTVTPTAGQPMIAYEVQVQPADAQGQLLTDPIPSNNTATGSTAGLMGSINLAGGGFACAVRPGERPAPLALFAAALLMLGLLSRRRRA